MAFITNPTASFSTRHQFNTSSFTSTRSPTSRPLIPTRATPPNIVTHACSSPPAQVSTPSSSSSAVPPTPTSDSDRKQHLLDVLSEIEDPDLHQNIVSLGFIKDIVFTEVTGLSNVYDVSFKVELTTPACPVKETFRSDCQRLAESIDWIGKASIEMTAMTPNANGAPTSQSTVFEYVNSIIAVASCKGGVGKSTSAVNLAYSLKAKGARVGILDADIYGPSLPTLIQPEERAIQFRDGRIQPLEYDGVKLMSFGYINPDSAIMRGPMISQMLNQIATTTQWGVLDYLIIDMPPGTGDVQITLSQILAIDAAVIVTTPQRLSFVDVIKGIDMFDKVNIPSIAVIENMAYFRNPNNADEKFHIFGKGHVSNLRNNYGIVNSFEIPIEPAINECSELGRPFVEGASDTNQVYEEISDCVIREVSKMKFGKSEFLRYPTVEFNEQSRAIDVEFKGETQEVGCKHLRSLCRCAVCVDEMTGKVKLDVDSIPEDIHPKSMRRIGNYATEIIWSDGHPSLYPFSRFVENWEQ